LSTGLLCSSVGAVWVTGRWVRTHVLVTLARCTTAAAEELLPV
jgi:hypothetical protein